LFLAFAIAAVPLVILDYYFPRGPMMALLTPRFEALRQYYGRELPESIKALYHSPDFLMDFEPVYVSFANQGINTSWQVTGLLPANKRSVEKSLPDQKHLGFPFATTTEGGLILIDLSVSSHHDGPVYAFYPDGSKQKICDSAERFVEQLMLEYDKE